MGTKRIGVAISDELGITAQALTTVTRGKWADVRETLRALVTEHEVGEIVIGLPRHMDGTLRKKGEDVAAIGKKLGRELGIPVVFWDERLSTVAAEKTLLSGDLSRLRRRRVIDRVAAAWILAGYLDWRKGQKQAEEQE